MLKTAFDLLWRYLRFYSLSYFGTLVILIWQSLLKFVKVCLNRRPGTSGLNWGHNSGFIQKVKLHFQASGFMPTHTDFERNSQTPSSPSKSNSHPLQQGRRSSNPRKLPDILFLSSWKKEASIISKSILSSLFLSIEWRSKIVAQDLILLRSRAH